jgi:protease YdgD
VGVTPVWYSHWMAAAMLCVGAIAAGAAHAGPCGEESAACGAEVAQLAPPSGHPSGLLAPEDRRVQVPSGQWPWSAVGRINVVFGPSYRKLCTGTAIGPRQVVTAAHCIFNDRVNAWGRPESMHFVLGQTGETFSAHSVAESFVVSPQFKFRMEDRPRYDIIPWAMVKHDWAILTLHDTLNVKPVPVRVIRNAQLPAAGSGDQVALAGYGQDRQYVLSAHIGCSANVDSTDAGTITHRCDTTPGESGGPILLLHDGDAALIGIHSADTQHFESQVGYQALAGGGVSASQFAKAVEGIGP